MDVPGAAPTSAAGERRIGTKVAWGTGGAVAALLVFFVVTAFTGWPGPGPLERYPVADLMAASDDLGCVASVDLLRSRVVIVRPALAVTPGADEVFLRIYIEDSGVDPDMFVRGGPISPECSTLMFGGPMPE